jgi:3-phytase
MRAGLLASLLLTAGCAAPIVHPAPGTVSVTASAETVPVGTANDDAADDPAIWRNARRPAESLIVATDKKAGLYVYGLDGKVLHFSAAGRLNNVDLIDRGRAGILVAASDRNDPASARLRLFRLDPGSAQLLPLGDVTGGSGEAYGICLWRHSGALYAFSVLKEGAVHQVRIDLSGATPRGTIVRTLRLATQPEGCVVDPRSGRLFVGEEGRGIWSFDARPTGGTTGTLVAAVDGRHLVADAEGLAIVPIGRTGGYLIASSQGDNSYALYALPSMAPAGRFRIVQGRFGATEETDGIAFHAGSFGAEYPAGLFVAQDGMNAPAAQNFKLVNWGDVRRALGY